MKLTLDVTKVVVVLTNSVDKIHLKFDCPTSRPNHPNFGHVTIDADPDYGKEWAETVLGLKVDEVMNVRTGERMIKI